MNALGEHGNMGISELSRKLGIPKSTAHKIIATLEHYRIVERNTDTNKFHLGAKLIELGSLAQQSLDICTVARPVLRELNEQTGETVHLTLLEDDEVLYVDCVESRKRLRTYSVIGVRAPLYCTSVGKAILAFQSKDYIQRYLESVRLERFTDRTLTDSRSLRAELDMIRSRGYAIDDMEHEDHIRCIGAPVRDTKGMVTASISVSSPVQRLALDDVDAVAALVVNGANLISLKYGLWEAKASPAVAHVS